MKTVFKTSIYILITCALAYSRVSLAQTSTQRVLIAEKNNSRQLRTIQNRLATKQASNKARALELAEINGWPSRYRLADGKGEAELIKVGPNNEPIYYETLNVDASISTRTNHLNTGGSLNLGLDGQDMTAYIWDGGATRESHQEYDGPGGNNRVTQSDNSTSLSNHATHVTGTILGGGINSDAKGMAPHATGRSYDWNDDLSEMTTAASNGMLISNHSYGYRWRDQQGNIVLAAYYGGAYIEESRDADEIMYNAPYYLMVSSAGNNGRDNTANTAPLDGEGAYDKLTAFSTAKNNLVIAAAEDVTYDSLGNITSGISITDFSSEGPTDDYRIKPDIAGNGADLYSPLADGDDAYGTYSGTSMSGPNVAGSLLLLQQYYDNLHDEFMRSATLKGLALHTAEDAGQEGPDAIFGWGLLNAKACAEVIGDTANTYSTIKELTLEQDSVYKITVEATDDSLILASISWTDPIGDYINTGTNNLTTAALVNDLDIRVTKRDSIYLPYALTAVDTTKQQDNKVDPYERVDVENATGIYTITITHKDSLATGSQNFSLIITGATVVETCEIAAPANLTASSIGDNSFNLSWSPVAGADEYIVTINDEPIALSDTMYEVTGLKAGTEYTCSVVGYCSEGGSGKPARVITKTTGSLPMTCSSTVSTLPHTRGFEAGFGWTQSIDDDGDWVRNSGTTPSSNTGPSAAAHRSYYLYLEASSIGNAGEIGNNATAMLESPCFDLSAYANVSLSIQYHMYGTEVGSLAVQAADSDEGWTQVWSRSGNQGDEWNTAKIDLSDYAGGTVKLRIVGTTGSGWSSDIAIDRLRLTTGGTSSSSSNSPTVDFSTLGEEISIEDITEGSAIVAYQIPQTDLLEVLTNLDSDFTYSIISMTGSAVSEGAFSSKENTIDIAPLAIGTYILKTYSSEGEGAIIRFIKE